MASMSFEAGASFENWFDGLAKLAAIDATFKGDNAGFVPTYAMGSSPIRPVSQETSNESSTPLWDFLVASQEQDLGLEATTDPNIGVNHDSASENARSVPARSPDHGAANFDAWEGMQDLFPNELVQLPAFDLLGGFTATDASENDHNVQAGLLVQQPAPFDYASPNVSPLRIYAPSAQRPAGHITGFMPIPGREIMQHHPQPGQPQRPATNNHVAPNTPPLFLADAAAQALPAYNTALVSVIDQTIQVAQSANSVKEYGKDRLAPHEIHEENGRYKPSRSNGPQRHPARRRQRDHQEPEQPRDNQEPIVDGRQRAPRPKNRQGATPGWPPRLRIHKQRCRNPAAGCDEACELREKHFDKYETLRKKPSDKCPHLPPEYRVELWDHLEL